MLRLRNYLNAKGIPMKGCAELLGVSEKTLYNKIMGSTEFTYGEVRRLKSVLPEYDMDYLLSAEAADTGKSSA